MDRPDRLDNPDSLDNPDNLVENATKLFDWFETNYWNTMDIADLLVKRSNFGNMDTVDNLDKLDTVDIVDIPDKLVESISKWYNVDLWDNMLLADFLVEMDEWNIRDIVDIIDYLNP